MTFTDEQIAAMSKEELQTRAELIIEEVEAEERVRREWFARQEEEWHRKFREKYYRK